MAASDVDIANLALAMIGKEEIASLVEDSVEARAVSRHLVNAKQFTLGRSNWTFALRADALALLLNDWEGRWSHRYDRPSRALRIVRLYNTGWDDPRGLPVEYNVRGNAIYANLADAICEYVDKNTAVTAYPAWFDVVVAAYLARQLVMPLTKKSSLWSNLNDIYGSHHAEAVQLDEGQHPTYWPQDNGGYIDARGAAGSRVREAADGSSFWS